MEPGHTKLGDNGEANNLEGGHTWKWDPPWSRARVSITPLKKVHRESAAPHISKRTRSAGAFVLASRWDCKMEAISAVTAGIH